MNKKKITYGAVAIIAVLLGYFNYFGEEQEIKEIRKVVETKNAVYESDEYYVEAEKEFDYIDDKESVFEKAKARIKGMLLSGDNVLLDKARNLILKSNIVGISPNGWKINASELKYEKETELLVSQALVSAVNEEQGIEISGNKFKTNISMDYIVLEEGVVIKNKFVSLLADKAEYSNETKKIVLHGNISIAGMGTLKDGEVENTSKDFDKPQMSKLSGKFNDVYYNLDERNLYAENGFEINYDGIILFGDKLILNDRDESFLVKENVKIKYQDYLFDVNSIEKKPNSQEIKIYGKIAGGNETYKLIADNGSYNIENKNFEILGNIELSSVNSEKLLADKFEYNLDSKDMSVYGNLAKYTSPTNNVEAEYFRYNTETKLLSTDRNFYAYNEKKQSLKGSDLKYSLLTKDFSAVNELILGNGTYEIKGENITYFEESGILTIPEKYELKAINGDTRVIGELLTYNRVSGELLSNNELNLFSKSAKINGKNIMYNNLTGLGKISGPIVFEDKERNISGDAKEILIKMNEDIELSGPINIKQNTMEINTENVIYKYSDELLHMDNLVTFKDDTRKITGKVTKAKYNPKTAVLIGYNFDMKEPTRSAKSEEIYYYSNDNKLELSKNVSLVSEKNNLKTQNLVYYLNNEDIELKSTSHINYDNYKIKLSSGKVNNKTGAVYAKNAEIVSTDKNTFSALETKGNINEGLIHFIGDVSSTVYNNEEAINFNGQMLDLYLEKIDDNYQAKKLIMNKPGIFTQLNRKLETDNLEADLEKNIVYLKNRPVMTIKNENKADTIGKANSARAFLDTKTLYLDGNVYVKDVNEKNEEIIMTSDRAEVIDRIASAYDNVKVVNNESVLTANEGHYDMDTKKLKLKGNVHVDYVTQGKGAGI
ncbi:MAG: LPS export ABC transporter periplasmic protein LptC [Fusobacterium sp.]|nr:LPS export ABC transporter periplasmic protein LptC [Fusobacterium sp.]